MPALAIDALTEATLEGSGVFDVLMRANKAHLESEFDKNRIKGPEYSTVYLGSLTQVLTTAVQFLLAGEKLALEKQLLEQQVLLAQVEVIKANAQVLQTEAQTELVKQQTTNLIAEALNTPKQGVLLDAQALHTSKQASIAEQEILVKQQQVLLAAEELKVAIAKLANIPKEGVVLDAQACKLQAEYDLLLTTNLKTAEEKDLLAWKTTTEKAQTITTGVDTDSVIGKQKALYAAQTAGYQRDAEQKAAKIMVDSWSVRRTTNEETEASAANGLNDPGVGRAVTRLLTGVGA